MKPEGKAQSRLSLFSQHMSMASEENDHYKIDIEAQHTQRKTQAQLRESRAAINFAPPILKRLNETYIRPRRTYYAANFQSEKNDDQLCANCVGINLPALFHHGLEHETRDEGIQVRKGIPVGYSDEIYARASCPFCRLLVEIGDNNVSGDARDVEFWWIVTLKGHEVLSTVAEPLYDIRFFDNHPGNLQSEEAVYLSIVRVITAPPGYGFDYRTIFKELSYIGLMEIDEGVSSKSFTLRNTGDAEELTRRIRDWLLRCAKHQKCLTEETRRTAHPDGFCLLDITALEVVDSFGHEPYIALSYACSQVDEFEIKQDGSYVLEALPKVLQDVIGLVKGLGLGINHIWMDRLCVPQDNLDQKIANINAMGDIYGAAFATVIFAVPSRRYLEHGIPGLSAPRPPYQRIEKVGNLKLATTYPSLDMAIATSQWNKRAWTYQEGLLSKRCILFGPEQSHFECAEMGCCESIKEPSVARCEQDYLIPYKSRLRNPFLDPYDFNSLYWRLVRDYTGRDMSFASDSLHAFAALNKEFERADRALTWGLPISSSALNLLWEHEPWDFREISRRDGFPSWSWAGWSGTAAMNFPLDPASELNCTCTIADKSPRSHILSCKARSAKVDITGVFPIFAIAGAAESSIVLDCGMGARSGDILNDSLMMEVCKSKGFVHGLLIVQQKQDVFHRIGSGFMRSTDFENAKPRYHEFKLE